MPTIWISHFSSLIINFFSFQYLKKQILNVSFIFVSFFSKEHRLFWPSYHFKTKEYKNTQRFQFWNWFPQMTIEVRLSGLSWYHVPTFQTCPRMLSILTFPAVIISVKLVGWNFPSYIQPIFIVQFQLNKQ